MCANRLSMYLVVIILSLTPAYALALDHSHANWNALLQEHVTWLENGSASQVDYDGLQKQGEELQRYLQSLSAITQSQFNSWSKDEQLAFLINAYNAFTVELILTKYPDIESIKDLGSFFSSPWKTRFFKLLGREQHLDGIEHELIRGSGRYNEPLIHFAVNCASIGCPALRDEAFVADRLDAQLIDQTRRFLSDRSRNRFDAKNGAMKVSRIFDWYAEDFAQGWRDYSSLKDFFAANADLLADNESERQTVRQGNYGIDFLSYDWKLNRK